MSTAYALQRRNQLNNTFSILDSFYHNLPDRHQELFFQPIHSFSFSKLPLELRLMVWRATSPRQRKIWLHPKKAKHSNKTATFRLPITPSIQACMESRQEIYRYMKVSLRSYIPICITQFDIVRFDFRLMIRIDSKHEELLAMLQRRHQLACLVREVKIMVDSFSEMDRLLLWMSWHDIFRKFLKLERLRLLVPAGADWSEKCRMQFEEVCAGCRTGSVGKDRPILMIEEA